MIRKRRKRFLNLWKDGMRRFAVLTLSEKELIQKMKKLE